MPQVFSEVNLSDVMQELRQRGYGVDSCKGFAFRLCVRSRTDISKSTGLGRWTPIGGPTAGQVAELRRTSRDVKHAADRIEAISLGRDQEVADSASGGQAVDMNLIGKLIDNKIDAKLRGVQGSLDSIMAALGARPTAPPEQPPVLEIPQPRAPVEPEPVMRAPLIKTPTGPPVEAKRRPGRPRKVPVEADA